MFSLHKISVSILLFFLCFSASASDPYLFAAGAAEAGMSYSCVMKSGFWSSFHNQALLTTTNSVSLGLNFQNRFNISELGTRSAALTIPVGRACLGIIYSHFGYKEFMRHSAGVASGLKLSKNLSAGIQVDLFKEKTPGEYRERQSLTFEAGLLITPSEMVSIGLHIFNPIPNSFRKSYLPSSIKAGAGIFLSKTVFVCAEAEMITGKNLSLKAGMEYEPLTNFLIRGGFSSENTSFSLGIGYLIKSVQLDLGFATHEILGVTSSASIIFQLK